MIKYSRQRESRVEQSSIKYKCPSLCGSLGTLLGLLAIFVLRESASRKWSHPKRKKLINVNMHK